MRNHRRTSSNTKKRQALFIKAFARIGNVLHAAKAAGINRKTHYEWLRDDKAYKAAIEHAENDAIDRLEKEAVRRASLGVLEPVFQGGKQVGVIRKYSDTLLIFLLKGARPDKYRDRQQIEQNITGRLVLNVSVPGEQEAKESG